VGASPFGILEFYRASSGELTESDIAAALIIADNATRIVLDDFAEAEEPDSTRGTRFPMFGLNNEVPEATGMIAVQLRVSLPEALAELRAAAFARDRPIRDIALDVVERRISFSSGGP
jgi:hypothetical protein